MLNRKLFVVLILAMAVGACSSNRGGYLAGDNAPKIRVNLDTIADAVPRHEPPSKYGNPDSYSVNGVTYHTLDSSQGFVERGIASWYGTKFHGRRTSSGDIYNVYAMTAAHKTLPLPTYAEVTNLDNGKTIIVKINDRGPFHDQRIIDLSYVAALKLDIVKTGTGRVEVRAIDPRAPQAHRMAKQAATPNTLPVAVPMPEPTTISQVPIPAASQSFYLQVGAFSSFINADKLRSQLAPTIDNPVIISKTVKQALSVYRVRIGPMTHEQEVEQLALKLARQGITHTSVVFD